MWLHTSLRRKRHEKKAVDGAKDEDDDDPDAPSHKKEEEDEDDDEEDEPEKNKEEEADICDIRYKLDSLDTMVKVVSVNECSFTT